MARCTQQFVKNRFAKNHGYLILALLVVAAWIPKNAAANWLDDVDYTHLVNRLGSNTPRGVDVPISQVEALQGSIWYFPDTIPPTNPQFTAGTDPLDPQEAINFIDGTGGGINGVSSHAANSVGRNFYGNETSLAGGANEVTIYEAGHWLRTILLHSTGTNRDPKTQNFRVQNFSWVSLDNTPSKEDTSRDVLQRFDFLVDRDNITAVVGLGNVTAPLPHYLAHSYNAIAVGRSDGSHSTGPTYVNLYGTGRTKPDIVAPLGSTSAATAAVSSAATMLHGIVAGPEAAPEAAQSEVIKAMLLAGATKQDETESGLNNWSHTPTQPLDSHYGAGELNIYNSYLTTLGGQTAGSTDNTGALVETINSHGWDYQTVAPGEELFYNLEIPDGSTATELSVFLTWNAEIIDIDDRIYFEGELQTLSNLDLTLYDSTAAFMDMQIDQSISPDDNVEHIYQTDLGPGTYTLKVSTDTARNFGLAWRLNTSFDEISADFDENGNVDGRDFLAWQRGYGTLLGASHVDGDADGDTDVDREDLAFLQESFGSPAVSPLAFAAVPEPGTLILALLAILVLIFHAAGHRNLLWSAIRRSL
ncbi:MAG: hypothetical protein ABGX16_01455 [Pirellulales bacterium]